MIKSWACGGPGRGLDLFCVASGLPKAMLSRIVPLKRVVSCSTMPICDRSEFERHIAQVMTVNGDRPSLGS